MLQRETLRRLWPRCPTALIDGTVAAAPAVFAKYGLDTPALVAIFMAQISHECGAGTEIVENLNYSAQRMTQVWPSRFPTIASALPYQHNPRALANKVYNGRMGNRPGSDDGYNFRGRGATNTTGQEGYAKLGARMGLDLINNPDLVNDPRYFLEAGVADFVLCGCLDPARRGNFRMVTRRLNGGYIGLAEREQWWKRWQSALAAEHGEDAVIPLPPPRPPGTLQQGDSGPEVKAIQQQLSDKGYALGADDGEFHEATRDAVLSVQANAGLPATGVIDQATKEAIARDPGKPVSEGRATASASDLREKGSGTIASADAMKKIGIGTAITGGATGADKSGALDAARDSLDKFSMLRSVVEGAQDAIKWASAHWWIIAIIVAGLIWYFGRDIILRRVADHRAGLHLGR